jgi:hypothetical protein
MHFVLPGHRYSCATHTLYYTSRPTYVFRAVDGRRRSGDRLVVATSFIGSIDAIVLAVTPPLNRDAIATVAALNISE